MTRHRVRQTRCQIGPGNRFMHVEFRTALLSDVAGIVRMFATGEREGVADARRLSEYMTGQHNPQLALPRRSVLCATLGQSPVGYVAGHLSRRFDCEGELQWIYVVASARRQRIGGALVCLLAEWFAAQRVARVCVNVDPNNGSACGFFSAHGARRRDEHWFVWDDISQASLTRSRP